MGEEIDLPFPAVTLTVNCVTLTNQAQLSEVGRETAKYCSIARLFEATGTELTVNWKKAN